MSELRFKVGDEVEVGVSVNDGGDDWCEWTTWRSRAPDAWRKARVVRVVPEISFPYMVDWEGPDGKPRRACACEKHVRPLAKTSQPRVAEAAATPSAEPECKCASYWNHDPGCAYAAWNQARRKRLG